MTRPARPRRSRPRARTTAAKRLTAEVRMRGWLELGMTPEEAEAMHDTRPRTRAECADVPRPCPYVSCKHHLYLDVNPETGSIKLNFPDLEPWELQHTCALDVAESGGRTLEETGLLANVTRERVRQVETHGLFVMRAAMAADGIDASDAAFPHVEHMSDQQTHSNTEATKRARAAYEERNPRRHVTNNSEGETGK